MSFGDMLMSLAAGAAEQDMKMRDEERKAEREKQQKQEELAYRLRLKQVETRYAEVLKDYYDKKAKKQEFDLYKPLQSSSGAYHVLKTKLGFSDTQIKKMDPAERRQLIENYAAQFKDLPDSAPDFDTDFLKFDGEVMEGEGGGKRFLDKIKELTGIAPEKYAAKVNTRLKPVMQQRYASSVSTAAEQVQKAGPAPFKLEEAEQTDDGKEKLDTVMKLVEMRSAAAPNIPEETQETASESATTADPSVTSEVTTPSEQQPQTSEPDMFGEGIDKFVGEGKKFGSVRTQGGKTVQDILDPDTGEVIDQKVISETKTFSEPKPYKVNGVVGLWSFDKSTSELVQGDKRVPLSKASQVSDSEQAAWDRRLEEYRGLQKKAAAGQATEDDIFRMNSLKEKLFPIEAQVVQEGNTSRVVFSRYNPDTGKMEPVQTMTKDPSVDDTSGLDKQTRQRAINFLAIAAKTLSDEDLREAISKMPAENKQVFSVLLGERYMQYKRENAKASDIELMTMALQDFRPALSKEGLIFKDNVLDIEKAAQIASKPPIQDTEGSGVTADELIPLNPKTAETFGGSSKQESSSPEPVDFSQLPPKVQLLIQQAEKRGDISAIQRILQKYQKPRKK